VIWKRRSRRDKIQGTPKVGRAAPFETVTKPKAFKT
jgi:hypothetical protein